MRYAMVICSVFLMLYVWTYSAFTNYFIDIKKGITRDHLAISMNKASDASLQVMLEESLSLDQDYAEDKKAEVDPYVGLKAYEDIVLRCADLIPTEENRRRLETKMPFFAIATEDGYYIGTMTENMKTIHGQPDGRILFSQKKPYVVSKEGEPPSSTMYSITINGTTAQKTQVITSSTGNNLLRIRQVDIGEVGSDRYRKEALSIKVNNEMISILEDKYGDIGTHFLLPVTMTDWVTTNPIRGVTVFAYLKSLSDSPYSDVGQFSIGATQIEKEDSIVAYTRARGKYYTFSSDFLPTDGVIDRYFTTAEEATKEGYFYDYTTFKRR